VSVKEVDNAFRRYRVLKAMVQRERDYTKGYRDFNRLFKLGILEKGIVGDPKTVAQETLDGLDRVVDLLGFLDIVSSFEMIALQQIEIIVAQTVGRLRDLVREAELASAAAGLLRNPNDPSWTLRNTFDVLRQVASAGDTEHLDAINSVRNAIAHGRMLEAVPLGHAELRTLLCNLIERHLQLAS
jgi:hypothetical protein